MKAHNNERLALEQLRVVWNERLSTESTEQQTARLEKLRARQNEKLDAESAEQRAARLEQVNAYRDKAFIQLQVTTSFMYPIPPCFLSWIRFVYESGVSTHSLNNMGAGITANPPPFGRLNLGIANKASLHILARTSYSCMNCLARTSYSTSTSSHRYM